MRQASNMIDNVHNLENVGMTRPQAEVLIKIVRSSVTEALEPIVRNMATKAELVELKVGLVELEAKLAELKASNDAQAAHNDAQMTLLRGELTEKIGANLKYMALSVGFSTIAIIAAVFVAPIVG